jgi:hypothetical protein
MQYVVNELPVKGDAGPTSPASFLAKHFLPHIANSMLDLLLASGYARSSTCSNLAETP